ncbi:hypothetical protein [Desulfobulbus alkaliphilus]|uniref:hypothetical protein n=1 Tax=Desulfobulbus alkaliphilus TaxID=869814 RepID=UPI0019656400|nr:hypothetical protein [Desulfobulbus alkaliphilus]MBM9538192.1 hypothetical protein [Desulfobulbus alkaliphilus]
MTPLAIACVQFLYLIALYVPMGWHRLGLPKCLRVGLGYLVANALALLVGYSLDMAGWFSITRVFVVWLTTCMLLNLLAYRNLQPFHYPSRAERRIYILLAVTWIVSVGIRLVDPLQNAALAGIDGYQFLTFYAWLLGEQQAIHDYPSGFALMTAMAPWQIQPYAAVRWAPHLVYLACLLGAFGLWRRVGGLRFALAITFLLGSAWFLYPITAFHPHFIQWTTVFIGLPALLTIYARLSRGEPPLPMLLLAMPVNVAFTMTSAYFALYLNVMLPLLVVATNLQGRAMLRRIVSSAVVALISPLTLLAYYGILVRYFFPYGQSGVYVQTQLVAEVSQAATAAAEPIQAMAANHLLTHPLVEVIVSFLSPTVPLNVSFRWLVYAVLIALGCWLWRRSRARRLAAMRLVAGVMIFSSFSAMTGIFELPAWQGRNVFIALYMGVAAALWTCIDRFPSAIRHVQHSPKLQLLALLCVAGPAICFPPVIGKNVPIANVIQSRNLPSDNQVLAELIRAPETFSGKKRLAVVPPINDASQSHLISNLLRLHYPHPREHAFPGYYMVRPNNPLEAFELDALLISSSMLALYPLPEDFEIHTTGRDYVFAIRRPVKAP